MDSATKQQVIQSALMTEVDKLVEEARKLKQDLGEVKPGTVADNLKWLQNQIGEYSLSIKGFTLWSAIRSLAEDIVNLKQQIEQKPKSFIQKILGK